MKVLSVTSKYISFCLWILNIILVLSGNSFSFNSFSTIRSPFVTKLSFQKEINDVTACPYNDLQLKRENRYCQRPSKIRLFSSFAADGSEYASKDKSEFDDDTEGASEFDRLRRDDDDSEFDETPTIELQPVPLSKNAGNRFVAFIWDRELDTRGKDALDLHYDRIKLTEDHVMFCRKANLYNESFNTDSMVDALWSFPILASDLKRVIGHALCLESVELSHVKNFLSKEPIVQMLTGGKLDSIPLYRWRHIRDYTLRIDDGRFGYPCMCFALDDDPESVGNLRTDVQKSQLEYLIRSEKVIATGPIHLPTEVKDDPSSIPVGDLILFNANGRDDAIEFVEQSPSAQAGLYKEMRVHFYNNLDITGKFVSEDPLRDSPCSQMKEAMEVWGYPVADSQTQWLNW